VCRQHDRASYRNVLNMVHEDDTLCDESIDDGLVVHDLVKAIHRSRERANHP